jgi:hypothetical protein
MSSLSIVMPGHSPSEGRRASHAYVPGIHVLVSALKDVDGTRDSGLPELRKISYVPQVGYTRLAVTGPAMTVTTIPA